MRGKHGMSATARQGIQSRDAEIETYRNAVARLTKERNEARQQLRDEQQRHRKAERELRARLDQAAAPKVAALEERLAEGASKLRETKRWAREIDAKNKKIARTFIGHLIEDGLTYEDALRIVGGAAGMYVMGGLEAEVVHDVAGGTDDKLSTSRHYDEVIEKRRRRAALR